MVYFRNNTTGHKNNVHRNVFRPHCKYPRQYCKDEQAGGQHNLDKDSGNWAMGDHLPLKCANYI